MENTLARAFRKLGVTRRDGLATALGLTPPAEDGSSTMVCTDIVDSTRQAATLGDRRWLELLHRHNATVREQVRNHGGVVVKSIGDGFLLAFRDPGAAVRCAISLQRALGEGAEAGPDLSVRMGLHRGFPTLDAGDLLGTDVNVAARIAGVATGGEILLSASTAELLEPGTVELGPERHAQLKGLPGTRAVHAVVWDAGAEGPLRRTA